MAGHNYKDLTTENIEVVEETIEFELSFFHLLSGTDKVEIVFLPEEDGSFITPEELEVVQEECNKQKVKLLYKVQHIEYSTIFDKESMLTGVIPVNNRGFYC